MGHCLVQAADIYDCLVVGLATSDKAGPSICTQHTPYQLLDIGVHKTHLLCSVQLTDTLHFLTMTETLKKSVWVLGTLIIILPAT